MASEHPAPEPDPAAPSGLPEGGPESDPLGVPEAEPEGTDAPRRGEDAMPGIATEGEPPTSG